ncbi:unnamed protein product [Rotaria sp. Silwood2]|nr:unnamed protein product [Rotaria sp. Silwood2]CAF2699436.1 unnamed protein product [Rotaria sp. Silwood2]CAF4221456.1 unnamed protein product [Rotaria sp. Silwood2]CAF4263907.1 unnamed protein product [Rotaria sp. Silwood2]CAF4331187.1 unnamed protein product [Rotaria sp. Silwood2]
MNETTIDDTLLTNKISVTTYNPSLVRAVLMPATSTSLLAKSPWYRQKFEIFRDVIEEKVRDAYPELPETYKLQPANIEYSTMKGYDLDFFIKLHDGRSTVVSISYGSGSRPPYTKEERRKLVIIHQNTVSN